MPFDPVETLRCVCLVSTSPYILVVRADSPARDIAGFHAMAKAEGAKLNYGSAGNGTPLHLGAGLYKLMMGVDLTHVAYRGTGPAITALLSGDVSMVFADVPGASAHIASGAVRPLATLVKQRIPQFPDVPAYHVVRRLKQLRSPVANEAGKANRRAGITEPLPLLEPQHLVDLNKRIARSRLPLHCHTRSVALGYMRVNQCQRGTVFLPIASRSSMMDVATWQAGTANQTGKEHDVTENGAGWQRGLGWLTDRLGRITVLMLGQAVLVAAVAVSGAATSHLLLGMGLLLLGLGWSAALIAGSTLLSESVADDARPGAQGASDFVMGIFGAAGGALAGVVLDLTGYGTLNVLAGALVLPVLLLAAVTRVRPTTPTAPTTAPTPTATVPASSHDHEAD